MANAAKDEAERKAKAANEFAEKANKEATEAREAKQKAEAALAEAGRLKPLVAPPAVVIAPPSIRPPPAADEFDDLPAPSRTYEPGYVRRGDRIESVPGDPRRFRCMYYGENALPVGRDGFNSWCKPHN